MVFAANDSIWTARPARAVSTAASIMDAVELRALGDHSVAEPERALVDAGRRPLLDGGQDVRAHVVDQRDAGAGG